MDPLLLVALLVAPPGADTLPPFTDSATRIVVAQAMARHRTQDTLVTDYSARLHFRLSLALGRRRWARIPPFAVQEQEALVHWQRPNDLRVDVIGRRSRARLPGLDVDADPDGDGGISRPWFIPRALGDSVRLLGNGLPARAALHPFAADGPKWYHYALVDSLRVQGQGGRPVKLLGIRVTPRHDGPALVAGTIWVDAESDDVVRFSFRFVGTGLWSVPDHPTREDSASAENDNKWANRILTVDADLEYALEDGLHWMPFRQTLSGQAVIPFIGDVVVPFEVTTTFDDYQINTGRTIAFTLPLPDTTADSSSGRGGRDREHRDSLSGGRRDYAGKLENGGRYELHVPPRDSLLDYRGWTDSLVLDRPGDDRADLRQIEAQLAAMSEDLSPEMTGRPGAGFAYEKLVDVFRYDRIEGLAPGFGWRAPLFGMRFTSVYATARYGVSDQRLTGRLELVREAPTGRWTLSGYREVAGVDRVFSPKLLANSVDALFTAHDDADWGLMQGGSLRYETSVGLGLDLSVTGRVEDERSVATEARSAVNDFLGGDGLFPVNPRVAEGTFGGATLQLVGRRGDAQWMIAADLLGGAPGATAKVIGEWRGPLWAGGAGPALTLRGGVATAHPLSQSAFRLGGPWTVRGYQYGSAGGSAFWAAQLDLPLRRGAVRPVLFGDAGQAGTLRGLLAGPVYADAGIGLSFLGGAVRFDLSQPLTLGGRGPRFDLVFGGAR